jgi:hypothetical protein
MVSFTTRPLYPRECVPGTNWTGGWLGPRAGLDIPASAEKRTPVNIDTILYANTDCTFRMIVLPETTTEIFAA